MKKLFLIFGLLLQMAFVPSTFALTANYRDIFEDFQQGLAEQSPQVEEGTVPIILPTYQQQGETGVSSIVRAIYTLLDFMKLVVAPIAVFTAVIMGARMVAAGRENEEVTTKAKNYATYAVEGLVVIFMSDALVRVIIGPEGEIFRQGAEGAQEFGRRASQLAEGMYNLVQVIIGSFAVLSLVTAGMRYVAGSYDDDQIATAKRQITWSLGGLFVVGVSEFVVKRILFPAQGTTLGVQSAQDLFAQVTNFIAGTLGTLAFVMGLYAGYLYVTARDNEDSVAKAKSILTGAAIGIILALAAFAITNTIVTLDVTR